jgi:2-dehydro-3-deoxyphosphogluconate aldolase/(4S)-4-hydroxy-2-oxoglutarate aldolase
MNRSVRLSRAAVIEAIERLGVVAVIRLKDATLLRAIVDALAIGGVRALEVTMTTPRAIELISDIAPTLADGFLIGAGTVLDAATARQAIEVGAQFVVSPVLRPTIIDECHRHDVAMIPGCFSPTEILDAVDAGADIVKVFPATSLGPGFFKDLRGPFPDVKLMPTGGVTIENAGEWIRAGAAAVGIGSALLPAKAIAARRFDTVTNSAERIMATVMAARSALA